MALNNRFNIYLTLCLLLTVSIENEAYSQCDTIEKGDTSEISLSLKYVGSGFKDALHTTISPFTWNGKEWIAAGGAILSSGLAYAYDDKITKFTERNQSDPWDKFSYYCLNPWGNGIYSGALIGGLYIHGLLANNVRTKRAGLLSLKAFTIAGGSTYFLKMMFHRHRPHEAPYHPDKWDGPETSFEYLSFPSAHTTTAFAVATVLAQEYKDKTMVPLVAYSLAGLTALSRVYDLEHWMSDVIFSAGMGYGIGKLVYCKNNWKIPLYPYANKNQAGFVAVITF